MNEPIVNESEFPSLTAIDMEENLVIDAELAEPSVEQPRRNLPQMMRKIPVTLTLEVGSAKVSLQDLIEFGAQSVVELDTLAGEPLIIKANGTPIGRAEVIVSGENYGLRVVEMTGLDLESLGK